MPTKRPPERTLLPVLTEDHPLMPIVQGLCPGSLFQWIADTPGQCESYLGFLVDDRYVLYFELPYRGPRIPQEVEIFTWRAFRGEIGQGYKGRHQLDPAIAAARDWLRSRHLPTGSQGFKASARFALRYRQDEIPFAPTTAVASPGEYRLLTHRRLFGFHVVKCALSEHSKKVFNPRHKANSGSPARHIKTGYRTSIRVTS
ncbi:hypothetical protein [Asticcacaulis sp. AC402]|uniref:hypothetical protein n=1 Tax=Asticcacaulis sp. AC402 TaxID=1282361 RepID=UPI0012DD738B|nr:hypothetical protein [Asticcacaulis sp. AC402]